LVEGVNLRGLIPIEGDVGVDVDEAWYGGVSAKINHLCAGRNLRGVGDDIENAVTADENNGVVPDFSFAVDQLAKANSLCGTRGFTRMSHLGAGKQQKCAAQPDNPSPHIHLAGSFLESTTIC
jgi:hypothetical protein